MPSGYRQLQAATCIVRQRAVDTCSLLPPMTHFASSHGHCRQRRCEGPGFSAEKGGQLASLTFVNHLQTTHVGIILAGGSHLGRVPVHRALQTRRSPQGDLLKGAPANSTSNAPPGAVVVAPLRCWQVSLRWDLHPDAPSSSQRPRPCVLALSVSSKRIESCVSIVLCLHLAQLLDILRTLPASPQK